MFDLITPLTIGLVGSFHCIGMCGPIAVALPLKKHHVTAKIAGAFLYNFGRTVTYGILGLLFGLLGRGIQLTGLQQWTSILLGVVMILSVLFPYFFKQRINFNTLVSGYAGRLISNLRKLFNNRSYKSLLGIGLLNGLLPCGLVYVAIAGAINTNQILTGAAFMVLFGIGTIPMMLLVSLTGNMISSNIRSGMRKVVPYFIVLLGILFILRGLSLGIPYISPKAEKLIPAERTIEESCCH
ncbi:sulfite exporter TauE/SafE family protein [uncultured Sunxiuqinia sp.]|uniref:sulfite exporter TauE/SafE family protein n=1 Tax=uncultured Sunxiuqinia sp. TaxID=1573825 RepID=UPI002AA7576B|nr:sulfite exporter TauE/SafE family protein [uncultured Sunxiuqinia sp.]